MTFTLVPHTSLQVANLVNKLRCSHSQEQIDKIVLGYLCYLNIPVEPKQIKKILRFIQKWNSQKFQLSFFFTNNDDIQNMEQPVFHSVSRITFLNLKVLDLGYNNIQSIEPISWIEMPSIKQIDFAKNLIINLRAFAKSNFPYLFQIVLLSNEWDSTQLKYISRLRIHKNNQKSILYLFPSYTFVPSSIQELMKYEAGYFKHLEYAIPGCQEQRYNKKFINRFQPLHYTSW